MKSTTCAFTLFALLFISFVAANDSTQNEIKADAANQVIDEQQYGGGYGGGRGGFGGGYGGGRGGFGGGYGGGHGGFGGGYGGGRGGGWGGGGGGHCRWGCCGGGGGYYGGGCKCCYSAEEALAYMQNEANP